MAVKREAHHEGERCEAETNVLEGDAGCRSAKLPSRGLADDARQTAHGDEQPHVAKGEAALLQQRGLQAQIPANMAQ